MSEPAATHRSSRRPLWHRARDWLAPHANRDGICLSRRHELLAVLRPIGPLRADRVDLPGAREPLRILHTADFKRLLDNAVYDTEHDYMPYWAEIWPSGVVLAAAIARDPTALRGKHVLEIGPGVGVTAVAAMQAGADLVVADHDAGSLALTALNTLDQTGKEPRTLRMSWRSPSRELFTVAGEGFPIVLGADLLYEKEAVRPLLELIERIVAPGGELWLAEPGREAATRCVKALHWRGWRGPSEVSTSPLPDPNYKTQGQITVHRLRRPRTP